MEEILDKIATSEKAFETLQKLKAIFDAYVAKVPTRPAAPDNPDAHRLLEMVGLGPGGTPNAEVIQSTSELVDCLIISSSDAEPDAKRSRADDDDDDQEASAVAVDFERFNEEDVVIDPKAIDDINAYQKSVGEPYVDPQFPPMDRSLYPDPQDAESWVCARCQKRSPYPPLFDMPTSREEAVQLESRLAAIRCNHCAAPPTHVAQVQFVNRPAQWLRASEYCEMCEMMYGQMPQGQDLKCRMCSHFLRDPQNHLTIGAPWKVIREEPRPEDVVQGALGNCWFAGALSVCTMKEGMIEKIVSRDFNPHGAYLVKLFHSGQWRSILIDDHFPTSKIFQGRFEGRDKVYYSRGGTLSYLQCNRRQLWVPLVEKAAAKMFKSYGALGGGTFFEALSMFSGYPTDTMRLKMPPQMKQNLDEQKSRRMAARMQAMIQGQPLPPIDDSEERDLEEMYDGDIVWTKLLSFKDAGYLMGMALTAEGANKTKEELTELGLQAPHAYCVLDVKEVMVNGKAERLMQVRNPWGERSPRTWTGDWGKDSPKWTLSLQKELGVVNASNVKMYDEMSIFWMSFSDVISYFTTIEVCRVHDTWETVSAKGWLTSGVGPGDYFEITVYDKTPVDIVVWQEKHIKREASLNAMSTNVDVGIALLRKIGTNPDGTFEYVCVESDARTKSDFASIECVLEGGYTYLVVPLCFGQIHELAPRRATCVVHSSIPVELEKVASSWEFVSKALWVLAKKEDRKVENKPGVFTYAIREKSSHFGYAFLVENQSDEPFGVQYDCSASTGLITTRTSMTTIDVVPPHTRMVLFVLSTAQNSRSMSFDFGTDEIDPSIAEAMGMVGDLFHIPQAITPLSLETPAPVLAPDEALLRKGEVLRLARETKDKDLRAAWEAKNAEQKKLDDQRREAAQKEKAKEEEERIEREKEEEDALAAALAMSVDPQELAKVQANVMFEKLVASGVSPTDAAIQVMKQGRKSGSSPESSPAKRSRSGSSKDKKK